MSETKQTIEELEQALTALNLPDVSVDEVLTLVREPLAHVAFKQDGGQVRVWTHACVFVLNLEALRISVSPLETVGLIKAKGLVRAMDALPKPKRQSRRAQRGPNEDLQHEPAKEKPSEIAEGLTQDVGMVQGTDGEGGEA